MASVYRRPDSPTWYARVRDERGTLCRRSTGLRDKQLALRWAVDQERLAERRRMAVDDPDTLEALSARERPAQSVLDEFLADRVARGRGARQIDDLRRDVGRFFEEQKIGVLPDIRRAVVERYYVGEASRTSAANANRQLRNLSSFVKWCLRRRWLPSNPLDSVERITARPSAKPPLTISQMRRLFEAVPFERSSYYLTACLLGLRDVEMRRLMWAHIDLELELLIFDLSKSGRVDILPIVEPLASAFRALPPGESQNPVFSAIPTWKIRRYDFRTAGVTRPGVGVHDFRRSLASLVPEVAECSSDVVRAITRHRATDVTSVYYQTIPVRVVRSALEAYSRAIFGGVRVCLGWDAARGQEERDSAAGCDGSTTTRRRTGPEPPRRRMEPSRRSGHRISNPTVRGSSPCGRAPSSEGAESPDVSSLLTAWSAASPSRRAAALRVLRGGRDECSRS